MGTRLETEQTDLEARNTQPLTRDPQPECFSLQPCPEILTCQVTDLSSAIHGSLLLSPAYSICAGRLCFPGSSEFSPHPTPGLHVAAPLAGPEICELLLALSVLRCPPFLVSL